MNTNSKHYELLAIEPWEIMEANFPPEEFVAYLKGNIIKYTLRDKGQALSDAQKIKHYAEKLIEVLETKENAKDNWTIPEEVQEEPEDEYKFKVGDRVEVLNWKRHLGDDNKATVIRRNDKSDPTKRGYLVELDKELAGWEATEKRNGVNCKNTWWVYENELKLLEEEPKKQLKPNKWYNAEDFTVEELKELLPVGTIVIVTEKPDGNRMVDLPYERLLSTTVRNIGKNEQKKNSTRVGISADSWWRRYFKIVEEN